MTIFLFILGALLLFFLVSGGYVFTVACLRRKEFSWLVEKEIKTTPYGKYYSCMKDADQWLRNHNAQDVYTTGKDGVRLHGLWVPNKNPVGTMLLVHGYRSTPLLDFGVAYPFYWELGFNILVPDQRCHGKSQGRFITFGVKESSDMLQWIDYHNQRFGPIPMVLSGLSMGASTVLFLADEPLPENVKAMIADCGFTSPRDIIGCVFEKVVHMPSNIVLCATDLFTRLFAGFSLSDKDSRVTLKNNRLPILIVHGTKDDFVPCRMSEEGFAACGGPKDLLLVDGAGHGVSFLVDPVGYQSAIMKLLNSSVLKIDTDKGGTSL